MHAHGVSPKAKAAMPSWAQPTLRGTTGFPAPASLRATHPRRSLPLETRCERRRHQAEFAFEPSSRDSRPPSARGAGSAIPRHQAAPAAPTLSRSPSAVPPPEQPKAAQPKLLMKQKDALIAARRHLDIALLARHRKRSAPSGPGASSPSSLGGRPASPPKTRPNSPGRRLAAGGAMTMPKGASQSGRNSCTAPSREAATLRRERPAGDADGSSTAGGPASSTRRREDLHLQDTDLGTEEGSMAGEQSAFEKTPSEAEGSCSSSSRHAASVVEQTSSSTSTAVNVQEARTDAELAEKSAVIEALQRQLEELRAELQQSNSTQGQAPKMASETANHEVHAELQCPWNATLAPQPAALLREGFAEDSGFAKQHVKSPPRPLIPKLRLGNHLEPTGISTSPLAAHHHPWALASQEAQLRSLEHSASESHLRSVNSAYDAAMLHSGGMYYSRPPGSETSSEDCWSTSHVDPETCSLVSSVNRAG
eukprot:TRINITY_DN63581_c0_g1_i1.p1 TRINITY_DN63581_c0_g1~~TRINITY_DN63581_c0_g1_i1.p1  ORF type:complete len:480 (-),score=79.44 TRINITY_DN63581_c0_g1_i1:69-1508(-)